MTPALGWTIVIVGLVLPLLHVSFSRDIAPAPKDAGCPFSPRAGWIVLVLFLGPIGWLMFMHSRRRRRNALPPDLQ